MIALPDSAVGHPIGDFRLIREIGRGGMGVVYEAEQVSLRRRVALKVLPYAGALDPRQILRFQNEAKAAACLHHTNIVPVHFVGSERGVHFYAMQFIDGQTLAALVYQLRQPDTAKEAGPPADEGTTAYQSAAGEPTAATEPVAAQVTLSTGGSGRGREYFRKVAELGVQAAEALDHAHQAGIVHRDIKPANLLLDVRVNLWVTDFGLAQLQQGEANLTLTGELVGTLRYMSPEQALAKRVVIDHRTDVYSLGATLYELLTLRPAFDGKDRQELLRQIAFEEPPRPRRLNRGIPAELETIVLKAMEKNPADRYATAQELADDLRRWLSDQPIRARRPGLLQRLRKWGRRHRGVVVAATITVGVIIIALAASTVVTAAALQRESEQKDIAQAQKHIAEEARGKEVKLRGQAERQRDAARWNAYLFSIPLAAQSFWDAGDVEQAEKLLDGQRPGEGERDLRGWEWYHLLSLCHDDLLTLREDPPERPAPHGAREGPYVAWSPNAQHLAWFGPDHTVRIWDVSAKQRHLILRGHSDQVTSAAWSPDGKRLATGSLDATIKIWDVATGKELPFRPTLLDRVHPVRAVAWSPDGKRLASTQDVMITVWDVAGARAEHSVGFPPPRKPPNGEIFPPPTSHSPGARTARPWLLPRTPTTGYYCGTSAEGKSRASWRGTNGNGSVMLTTPPWRGVPTASSWR